MTVSIKAEKKVAVRRFAKAAVVAALLSTFLSALLSTRGAAQGTGGAMQEPALCNQGLLDKCSLQIWKANSFAKKGDTQSQTFSNGDKLTCTSNGANVPRRCELISPGPQQSLGNTPGQDATGSPRTLADPHDQALRQQCADLKQYLSEMETAQSLKEANLNSEKAYYQWVTGASPADLETQIQIQEDHLRKEMTNPEKNGRQLAADLEKLRFLRNIRDSRFLGPELGGTTPAQMQAKANQIIQGMQNQVDDSNRTIDQLSNKIKNLNCDNVPVPAEPSGP